MPVADELAGPLAYSAGWLWLLILLTVLPVLLGAARRLVPVLTRVLRDRRRGVTARELCIQSIAEIEVNCATGILSERQAHIALSRTVRDYVMLQSGDRFDTMTLQELSTEQHSPSTASPELVEAVRKFYDGAFADRPATDIGAAADSARRAVLAWT